MVNIKTRHISVVFIIIYDTVVCKIKHTLINKHKKIPSDQQNSTKWKYIIKLISSNITPNMHPNTIRRTFPLVLHCLFQVLCTIVSDYGSLSSVLLSVYSWKVHDRNYHTLPCHVCVHFLQWIYQIVFFLKWNGVGSNQIHNCIIVALEYGF